MCEVEGDEEQAAVPTLKRNLEEPPGGKGGEKEEEKGWRGWFFDPSPSSTEPAASRPDAARMRLLGPARRSSVTTVPSAAGIFPVGTQIFHATTADPPLPPTGGGGRREKFPESALSRPQRQARRRRVFQVDAGPRRAPGPVDPVPAGCATSRRRLGWPRRTP